MLKHIMNDTIPWVSFSEKIRVGRFELSSIHVAKPNCPKPVPGFVLDPTLPIETGMPSPFAAGQQANYHDLTPRQRGDFLIWWQNHWLARSDGPAADVYCRIAVANFGVRLLNGDTDERLQQALGSLQQDHQATFLRTNLAEEMNQFVQFAAYRRGAE